MGQNYPESPEARLTQNIYRLADSRGITRNRLAELAGIDDTSLYRKLDRKPLTFTFDDILGLSDALGVSVMELCDGL